VFANVDYEFAVGAGDDKRNGVRGAFGDRYTWSNDGLCGSRPSEAEVRQQLEFTRFGVNLIPGGTDREALDVQISGVPFASCSRISLSTLTIARCRHRSL
jgi:hypothetical protein